MTSALPGPAVRPPTRPGRPPTRRSPPCTATTRTRTWSCPGCCATTRLYGRDAAFATELTYGTLRVRGTLDAIIAAAAGRDMERIDPPARDALRLGAYQLLYTRVPAHAAVSSTVDLVRSVAPGAAGFANAVLREISGKRLDDWIAQLAPDEETDPVGYLALAHSHPEWIVRAFAEALGGDARDDLIRLLIEDNEAPPVHLCARPGLADAVELADEVGGAPGAFSPYAVYLGQRFARRPGRDPPGAGPRAGRGFAAGGRGAGAGAPLDGPRRPLARSVRRPGRQGRAARRARRAAWCAS